MGGENPGKLLPFGSGSDANSPTPKNDHESSWPSSNTSEMMPISPEFLADLQWLAKHHPHAVNTLADTARDMRARYVVTDTLD